MTEQFANNAVTTLTIAITTGSSTLSVVNSSIFPSTGNFRVIVGNEIMICTANSSNILTVTRAQEGTTAATAGIGTLVAQILTAGAIEQFRADTITTNTNSSLPTAGVAGRLFLPSNYPVWLLDNGTSWQSFGPIYPFVSPLSTTFSWVNQGTATEVVYNNARYLRDPGSGARSGRLRITTIPSPPYTITACILPFLFPATTGSETGIVLYDSGSGKLVYLTVIMLSTFCISGYTQNSVTSFNGQYFQSTISVNSSVYWLQFRDDGTTRYFNYSVDGVNFETLTTATNTNWITPTNVGYFVDSNGNTTPTSLTLLSWLITTP